MFVAKDATDCRGQVIADLKRNSSAFATLRHEEPREVKKYCVFSKTYPKKQVDCPLFDGGHSPLTYAVQRSTRMEQYRPAQATQVEAVPNGIALALLIGFQTTEDNSVMGLPFAEARCERLPFTLLHAALACAPGADFVVSPLVGEDFDAMDVAHELQRAGYRGRYVVVTPALPNPAIIRNEIRQACPGLTIELIPRARH